MDLEAFVSKNFVRFGGAGVGFSDEDNLIVFDPYINFTNWDSVKDYIEKNSKKKDNSEKAKLALFSHGHYDHGIRINELDYYLFGEGFTLVMPEEIKKAHERKHSGYAEELLNVIGKYEEQERLILAHHGDKVPIAGGTITAFQAKHAKIKIADYMGMSNLREKLLLLFWEHRKHPEGTTFGYLMEIEEKKIVFLGSCGLEEKNPEYIKNAELLFLPLIHKAPYEAEREIISLLKPAIVVPTHNDGLDALMPRIDAEDFKKAVKDNVNVHIIIPLYLKK